MTREGDLCGETENQQTDIQTDKETIFSVNDDDGDFLLNS